MRTLLTQGVKAVLATGRKKVEWARTLSSKADQCGGRAALVNEMTRTVRTVIAQLLANWEASIRTRPVFSQMAGDALNPLPCADAQ